MMCLLCPYRTTVLAAVAFLDAFQKVADMATNTRGRNPHVCVCVCVYVCVRACVWPHATRPFGCPQTVDS